jgi:hypothetical protein
VPAASGSDVPDVWPVVEIPPGSQLDLIAVNRPLGHTIEVVSLTRDDDSGSGVTAMHPVLGASPWASHFTTIGLGRGGGSTEMQPWPTGAYHLELLIGPDRITRTLRILVDRTRASSSPTASAAAPS